MSNDVLVGTGRQGDFVHASQPMGTAQGFKNVSGLWLPKTITFEQGLDALEKERANRSDILAKLGDISIAVVNAVIAVTVSGARYFPTQHALLQMATWLDVPHTLVKHYSKDKMKQNGDIRYERDERDTNIILTALNLGLSRMDKAKEMLWRTYTDGTLRALLSDSYGIIDNRWYLETLREAIPGGRLSHWRGDADTIYGNVLIPDSIRFDTDSDYGGMLSLSNSEIGTRKLAQYPSVFRAICMNGCIWDQKKGEKLVKFHKGEINYDNLRGSVFENLNKQIPLMADHVERFLAMRDRKATAKMTELLALVAGDLGLNKVEAKGLLNQYKEFERGDKTAFGLINTITRAGQTLDNESWVAFDNYAGSLVRMSDSAWESFNAKAKLQTETEVISALGLAV